MTDEMMEYAAKFARRKKPTIEEIFHMGTILNEAHSRFGANYRPWVKYDLGLSRTTEWRYRTIASRYKSPDDLQGLSLNALLKGGVGERREGERQTIPMAFRFTVTERERIDRLAFLHAELHGSNGSKRAAVVAAIDRYLETLEAKYTMEKAKENRREGVKKGVIQINDENKDYSVFKFKPSQGDDKDVSG